MSSPGGRPRSARYFFHLHKGDELIHDEIGVEVSGDADVRDAFVQCIREMQHERAIKEYDVPQHERFRISVQREG
jgi:hypothetical protein